MGDTLLTWSLPSQSLLHLGTNCNGRHREGAKRPVHARPGHSFSFGYHAPGALGSGDAYCPPQTPPLATIRKEYALQLIERLRVAPS